MNTLASPRPWNVLAALAFGLPAAACAQDVPDSWAKTPYDVQVVLHIIENRFLTPLFQEQLQKEIHDRLQIALGKLGNVQVTRTHRLLGAIEAAGLGPALDDWDEELNETRTCFVQLEYLAGRYRLQTRQHDGWTGLATPLVRQLDVSDRGRIAQAAVELIRHDFGLVGTVTKASGDEAFLTLRGGELASDLSAWVREGQVFAVCRLMREGDRWRSQRLAWTVAEAAPGGVGKGPVRCRVWRRYEEDDLQPSPGVMHRCLLLPPVRTAIRVRFLDEKTFEPQAGLEIHLQRPGDSTPVVKKSTDLSGLVEAKEEFSNLALVLLKRGERLYPIPLALVDDRTVVCLVRSDAKEEERAAAEYRLGLWERRSLDNIRLSSERLREINQQILVSFADALDTARLAAKSLRAEIDVLEAERDSLIKRFGGKAKAAPALARGDGLIRELMERHKDMQARAARYEEALKESGDKKGLGLKGVLEKARLHEELAEFDQAIHLYDTLLKVSPDLKKVRDYADDLKSRWEVKGAEHAAARKFVYETWPGRDVFELEKHLDAARQALKACQAAGDRLSPLRVMKANEKHAANLDMKLRELARSGSEDSRNRTKILQRVARDLGEIEEQARGAAGKAKK